ncbi:hypothetical protein LOTGIDRAFT_176440 [Lottia gigantea]|uniref:DUF7869 domain-containing protein n=1 Tax=Lottia gigantea TaxID=225164 RepID=V4ACF2_LOTGI|nr:hypothetical protein LOTGIDRAFT_176440 [Lottia gigantea]ESP01684.1 hypothetical protein LOTGIDRAFT_176440 [Lottia gigantea]
MASRRPKRCANLSVKEVVKAVLDSEDEFDDSDQDPDFTPNSEVNSDTDQPQNIIFPVEQNKTLDADRTPCLERESRSRKRKRDPSTWKRNVKRNLFNSGKYGRPTSASGHADTERQLGPVCGQSCRLQCCTKISQIDRMNIFKSFWGMNNHQRRRDFVVSHAKRFGKKRNINKAESRRKHSIYYYLPVNEVDTRVCKKMFLNTLDISDFMVKYNLDRCSAGIIQPPQPKEPANKTPLEMKEEVINHIKSFPKIDSHYCRSTTKREYLDSSLNIKIMYRLYLQRCQDNELKFVTESMYRYIFNTEFNLGFHVPSKDLCDTCTKFDMKKESGTFDASDEAELINHLRRKEQARTAKSVDKFVGDTITAVFDLQQVMVAPKLSVGSAYYLRKLNVYNFTVLELQTLQGFCYTWHECEGKRGTNEIASCLLKWLKAKDNEGYHSAILYSDSCGGQNRNRIMCSAILQFLSQAQNIEFVEQKFFESGHSQNECDSMHSCIEREYKSSNVFLPSAYHESMRKANKKQPYIVIEITHNDIIDYERFNSMICKQNAFSGIMTVHHIIYSISDNEQTVSFAHEIGGEMVKKSYRKQGHPCDLATVKLTKAYQSTQVIDKQKKADLLKLCDFIPRDCRHFYNGLLTDC